MPDGWDAVDASVTAKRTSNPIRKIIDQLAAKPNPDLKLISLSIGDPTVYGNLPPPEVAIEALNEQARGGKRNGYAHSCGFQETREAIAAHNKDGVAQYTAEDVITASGCSGALDLCIGVIANEGDNILLPLPGFSLYQTLCDSRGIECKFYNLLPEKGWSVDIEHLKSLCDAKTKAILINNPSNPCGSVFSRQHLDDLLFAAAELKLPIISDEIYANMTFSSAPYHSLASISTNVPILTTSGLAKRYMLPGWRLGYVLVHDPVNAFTSVRTGLKDLTTLTMGANTVAQAAVPRILQKTSQAYYDRTMKVLKQNADLCFERINAIHGLSPVRPEGAMYLMVKVDVELFDDVVDDDVTFARTLLSEQSVFVLPGSCFNIPNYFRVVVCPPQPILEDAFDRIASFCQQHCTASAPAPASKKRKL